MMGGPFDMLAGLAPPPPDYTPADRYRDYRATFLATAQGRRVLYELLTDHCHLLGVSARPGDTHGTYLQEGERNVGLRIMAAMQPPADLQETTVSEIP